MLETLDIRQFRGREVHAGKDVIVSERVVTMVINGDISVRHSMSPALYREFATGFLLTSGMVSTPGDIGEILVNQDEIAVSVANFHTHTAMVKGAAGGFTPWEPQSNEAFSPRPPLDYNALFPLFATFSGKSTVFRQTGGTHSAALSAAGEVLYFAEDIGRHNAVDKAVGLGVLGGEDLSRMVLLTSGRISSEIVNKAINARIPVIISHSASTSLAIQRARRVNMTLIGFLRGDRFTIYC